MQLIGTISGDVSPSNFNILLSASGVGRGAFVQINHEEYGWVLAKVSDLKRSLSNSGEEIALAKAYTIGYKQDGVVKFPKTPFKPNDRVYSADGEIIINVIGLRKNKTGNIYLGVLDGSRIPVYIDLNKTIRKHVSVLAMTGAGKSYTVCVILEELLKNDIPIVIIDPHREYSSLRYENDDYEPMLAYGVKPASYASKITEYTTSPLTNPDAEKLTLKMRFSMDEITEILPVKLADKQKIILYNALHHLEGQEYGINDLINVVRMEKGKDKWKVINVLETLAACGLFDEKPVSEKDLVKPGHASIIDLKGSEPWVQQLVVTRIAKELFAAMKLNQLPAFFFLVEEAHNFCPERGFGEATSSEILRTIASEGRKFGLHMCVVSQRPARVDKNVLSQCNTQIILKVTNPNDLRAIGQSIEGFTSGMESDIKQLSVGQALVVGECVEQPIVVNIRARESKHIGAVEAKGKNVDAEKKPVPAGKVKPIFEEGKEFQVQEAAPRDKKEIIKKIKPVFIKEKEPTEQKETKDAKQKDEGKDKEKKDAASAAPKKKSFSDRIVGIFLKDEEEMTKK